MRTSTRYTLLCVLFISISSVLCASQASSQSVTASGRGQQTVVQELALLNRRLNLSDSQQAAILPLLQNLQAELQTLDLSSAARAIKADGKHSMVAATNAQIRGLLSESQQNLFDQLCSSPRSGVFSK